MRFGARFLHDASCRPYFDRRELVDSLTQILRNPNLCGGLFTVLATSMFCGPLVTFAPVLVKRDFGGCIAHFSAAVGAFGIGGILGAAAQTLRGRMISLYMLCVRGGAFLGGLLAGLSVSALGVRKALFVNGMLAVILQVAIGRAWRRAPGLRITGSVTSNQLLR